MKRFNKAIGIEGENIATTYLNKTGYKIIERNYSSRFGEIDIVASINNCLVFVEVKTKTGTDFGVPEEMISKRKIKQIQKMADLFILKNATTTSSYNACRIDVIAIVLTETGEAESIHHYEEVGSEFL